MNVCVFLFPDGRNLKYQITTITCVSRSFWVSYVYCGMCISSLVFTLNSSCAWLLTYLCIKLLLVHMVVLWYRSRKMRTKCHFREHLKEQNGNTKSQQWTLRARQCQYQNIPTTRWGYQIIFFIWFTFPKSMPEKKATKKHPIKGNSRQYRHFYTITKAQLFFACRLTVSHWKWKRLKIFLASHAKQITIVLIWNVFLNILCGTENLGKYCNLI